MPDRNDDDDNLVPFRHRNNVEKNGRERQKGLKVDPADVGADYTE
jgi:hypothetical protein